MPLKYVREIIYPTVSIMNILTLIFTVGLAVPIYVWAKAKNLPFVILYIIFMLLTWLQRFRTFLKIVLCDVLYIIFFF